MPWTISAFRAYFPLSVGEDPTLDQLRQGWEKIFTQAGESKPPLPKEPELYLPSWVIVTPSMRQILPGFGPGKGKMPYCLRKCRPDAIAAASKNVFLKVRVCFFFFFGPWHQPWVSGAALFLEMVILNPGMPALISPPQNRIWRRTSHAKVFFTANSPKDKADSITAGIRTRNLSLLVI